MPHVSATQRFTDDGFKPTAVTDGALAVAGSSSDEPRETQVAKLRDAVDAGLLSEGVVDELIAEGFVELD